MNYTCLGNNEYEITLTIRRDCYNGNPNAWSRQPTYRVFDVQNNLLQEILSSDEQRYPQPGALQRMSGGAPQRLCAHHHLPDSHQPAANFEGISWFISDVAGTRPSSTLLTPWIRGLLYGVTISERALEECNSNPKFQQCAHLHLRK